MVLGFRLQGGRWTETVLSGPLKGDLGKCTCDSAAAGALLGLLQPTTPRDQNCRGLVDVDTVHERCLESALEFERNRNDPGFRGALG